ncbi:hypothetical protein AALP_AA7G155800 [Arabis alpina]|uniref:Uncharacterized protein n=1 Tax=Arabis alpina TaxID=50452 RepID=A0A087GIA2_ARAAL|nr:hypothetical protein AALP_AA7G155800 [Arabis alpina]
METLTYPAAIPFVGRQTWECDPDTGTREEHAAVEEARRSFLVNRPRVKGCSDLLWRMQFLKEAKFEQVIRPVKIDEGGGPNGGREPDNGFLTVVVSLIFRPGEKFGYRYSESMIGLEPIQCLRRCGCYLLYFQYT